MESPFHGAKNIRRTIARRMDTADKNMNRNRNRNKNNNCRNDEQEQEQE
jgi:hypothetical protein